MEYEGDVADEALFTCRGEPELPTLYLVDVRNVNFQNTLHGNIDNIRMTCELSSVGKDLKFVKIFHRAQ